MRLADINAAGYAFVMFDIRTEIAHFDCGNGRRYTLPRGAVFCSDMLPGYKHWVARIEDVLEVAAELGVEARQLH